MSDLAQYPIIRDHTARCFDSGHSASNNICIECSNQAAREFAEQQTAALRELIERMRDVFQAVYTEAATPVVIESSIMSLSRELEDGKAENARLLALVYQVPLDHTCHERSYCRGCDWIQRRDAILAGVTHA